MSLRAAKIHMKNKNNVILRGITTACYAYVIILFISFLYGCSDNADNICQNTNDEYSQESTSIDTSVETSNENADTVSDITFESDYEARKAVYNAIQLPLSSSAYTDESLKVYMELTREVSSAMSKITASDAAGWIEKINVTIDSFNYKEGPLPTIYIKNEDGSVHSSAYHNAVITFIDSSGSAFTDKSAQIKLRGNSTRGAEKPPYTIKFTEKQAFLGMDAGRKWILLAEAFDKTMMRNKLAFDFAQKLRFDFSPQCEYVDVYVDGDYRGVYLLTEAVTDGRKRVDIDVDKGDFLLELESDRSAEGVIYIKSPGGVRFKINKPEELGTETVERIKETISSIEEAIKTGDIEHYSAVADIDSFVDFYIFKEYFKDVDAYYSSTRFYIKNGKLYAGPPWDNDLSCGNASYQMQEIKYKSYCNYKPYGTGSFDSADGEWNDFGWFAMLWADDDFKKLVYERWKELRPAVINIYEENELGQSRIDCLLDEYGDDFERNYTVWDIRKHYSIYENQQNGLYDDHLAFLREWLEKRASVVDELFNIK